MKFNPTKCLLSQACNPGCAFPFESYVAYHEKYSSLKTMIRFRLSLRFRFRLSLRLKMGLLNGEFFWRSMFPRSFFRRSFFQRSFFRRSFFWRSLIGALISASPIPGVLGMTTRINPAPLLQHLAPHLILAPTHQGPAYVIFSM